MFTSASNRNGSRLPSTSPAALGSKEKVKIHPDGKLLPVLVGGQAILNFKLNFKERGAALHC